MKVAQYSLYFSFFIFFITVVFSEAYAKETSSLNLRGFVDPTFQIEIENNKTSYTVNSTSNFDFYGYIDSDGIRVTPGQLLKVNGASTKKITVSIN